MDQEKKVSIELTTTEVKELLMRHLDITQAHNVADVIIGHLVQTEKGLGQLFKGLIGVFPTLKYKEKDFVYVNIGNLPSWRMDKAKTAQLPGVVDGYILAQILECNVYKGAPYKVAYQAIKENESIPVQEIYDIGEISIKEKAEDFIDILDALEKLKDSQDAPF
jgi:hypothetical protein